MRDVAAARARLIDLFSGIGCSLIREQCGSVPDDVATHLRATVTTHMERHPDKDIWALSMVTEDELRAWASELLIEPFRQIAAVLSGLQREAARNGLDN